MNPNPLSQYFRTPALHVALPSGGKFYPKNAIDLTADNQYPILPLSRQDELIYLSASSQYTSSSIASIITSCVPNIKDVWKMPAIDVDALLVAIKIASQGPVLEAKTVCTNCETENKTNVDLNQILNQFQAPDYNQPKILQDLKIYFRPISYQQANDNIAAQIGDEDLFDAIDENADDQTRTEKIDLLLAKIRELSTDVLAKHILYIELPHSRVDNYSHIFEWLSNCDRQIYLQLQQHIVDIKNQTEVKPLEITCASCGTHYQQSYSLNLASAA